MELSSQNEEKLERNAVGGEDAATNPRTIALIHVDAPHALKARPLYETLLALNVKTKLLPIPGNHPKMLINEEKSHVLVFVLAHGGRGLFGRRFVRNSEMQRINIDGPAFEQNVSKLTMFVSTCEGANSCPERNSNRIAIYRPPEGLRANRAIFVHHAANCLNLHEDFIENICSELTSYNAPRLVEIASRITQNLAGNEFAPPNLISNQDPNQPLF